MADKNKFHRVRCPHCLGYLYLHEDNSIVFIYTAARYLDYQHILFECDDCKCETMYFVDVSTIEKAVKADCIVITSDNLPDDVLTGYNEMHGWEIPKTRDLTPRLERLVEQLGRLLEGIPDDLLMEIFEHPPPRSNMPQDWS